jgi:hypothetical protein
VVGASDASGWARFIVSSSATIGFTGPLIPVHPAHPTVFGRPLLNPLWVNGDQVEALDVLVITEPAGAEMHRAEADGAAEMELTT